MGPEIASHPLVQYARENENLVITPHIGGVTCESQGEACRFMVRKLQERIAAR